MTKTVRVTLAERDAAMRRSIARSGFQINVTPELVQKLRAQQMRPAAARAAYGPAGRQPDHGPAADEPAAPVPPGLGTWSWTGPPVPPTLLTRARLAHSMAGLGSTDAELLAAVGLTSAQAAEMLTLHAEASALRQRLQEVGSACPHCVGPPAMPATLRSRILRAARAASTTAVRRASSCLSHLSGRGHSVPG